MLNERLTWEEMKKKYPNAWVAYYDAETDNADYMISGRVFYHCQNKAEFISNVNRIEEEMGIADQVTGQQYTGVLRPPSFRGRIVHIESNRKRSRLDHETSP